ncbi:MAG TPA: DUF4625 domain-containing protein [Niabella sp.]|nr:DUF4625 domain-containing protein [Niabella sp.]
MKYRSNLASIFGLFIIGFLFSCKKENNGTLKPEVVIKEVGVGNSKIAYPGNSLHLDADITAPGKIGSIKLQITLASTNYGWDFVKTYTEGYAGAKNTNFHVDVEVPENATAGQYNLLLIVTDEQGEKTQKKAGFEIVKDATLPVANNAQAKLNGDMLNVTANISAPNKIAKIAIEVQSPAWTKAFDYTDADLVGQTTYSISKNIDMSQAPNGHYHVNIFITDQAGKKGFRQLELNK